MNRWLLLLLPLMELMSEHCECMLSKRIFSNRWNSRYTRFSSTLPPSPSSLPAPRSPCYNFCTYRDCSRIKYKKTLRQRDSAIPPTTGKCHRNEGKKKQNCNNKTWIQTAKVFYTLFVRVITIYAHYTHERKRVNFLISNNRFFWFSFPTRSRKYLLIPLI